MKVHSISCGLYTFTNSNVASVFSLCYNNCAKIVIQWLISDMEKKENIFNKFADKLIRNRIVAFDIFICMGVGFCIIFGLFLLFAYNINNLKDITGTIAKFDQHDKEWYDYIGGSTGSYLYITFEDGTFFEAKGIAYNNIDRELFETIRIGEEIKITYNSSWSRPNRIYAIEYNGVNYLLLDDVLAQYENEHKSSFIAGLIIIVVSVLAGGVGLFIVNYKYRKNSLQNR